MSRLSVFSLVRCCCCCRCYLFWRQRRLVLVEFQSNQNTPQCNSSCAAAHAKLRYLFGSGGLWQPKVLSLIFSLVGRSVGRLVGVSTSACCDFVFWFDDILVLASTWWQCVWLGVSSCCFLLLLLFFHCTLDQNLIICWSMNLFFSILPLLQQPFIWFNLELYIRWQCLWEHNELNVLSLCWF